MSTKSSRLTLETIGDIIEVQFLDKRINEQPQVDSISEELSGLILDKGCRKLLLNFANVEYMSSMMAGPIPKLHRLMLQHEGKLVLCSISPFIFELFKILMLDQLLTIEEDEEDGLKAFR